MKQSWQKILDNLEARFARQSSGGNEKRLPVTGFNQIAPGEAVFEREGQLYSYDEALAAAAAEQQYPILYFTYDENGNVPVLGEAVDDNE